MHYTLKTVSFPLLAAATLMSPMMPAYASQVENSIYQQSNIISNLNNLCGRLPGRLCSKPPKKPQPRPPQSEETYNFRFRNSCDKEVKVLTNDRRAGQNNWQPRGYFFLKPGQTTSLVPNSTVPMIGYWAETLDGSFTWENGLFTPSGKRRIPLQIYGRDHIMRFASIETGRSDTTVTLLCNATDAIQYQKHLHQSL